jgi:hypothetical protein
MKKPAEKIIAHVDPDLRDLIPGYLENRLRDLTTIKNVLKAADFAKIRVLGHSIRGGPEAAMVSCRSVTLGKPSRKPQKIKIATRLKTI